MKTWTKAILMAAIAIVVAVGTAFATQWLGSSGADQMYLYDGDDTIHLAGGDDLIQMGPGDDQIVMGDTSGAQGFDVINFLDGNAHFLFHGYGFAPSTPVYMEYLESDENLTLYTAKDFVIQLGQ